MSRIGKKPIAVPKGVKIDVQPGVVEVKGPKGKLRQALPAGIGFELEGDSSARGCCATIRSSASSTASRAAWWPTPSAA